MESLAGARSLALVGSGASQDPFAIAAAEHFDRAAVTIGFATLFDLLDGRVARMTNATSEFGLELDSIADVVSFGLAPAVLAFAWGYGQFPELHKLAWMASFLYLICGALRLARFNVQTRQHIPSHSPKVDKKAFVGMPIPVGAAMIAALAHFAPWPLALVSTDHIALFGQQVALGPRVYSVALIALVIFLGTLMVSTIRYSSFKNVGVKDRNPRIVVLGITLLVLAIWFYSRYTLLILATIYASHGVILKLWSMLKPRRAADERAGLELESKPHG